LSHLVPCVAGYSHLAPVAITVGPGTAPACCSAGDFKRMACAYADTGGLLGADELASRIAHSCGNGVGVVARWIVSRRVLSVHWQERYWLPAFQFTRPSFLLRASVEAVLEELTPAMDDWSVAQWFCSPNEWLAGKMPASAIPACGRDVLSAARACRFALKG
jgi:hypothetical protein